MTARPLVSVKMITYNHAPFIARAIQGVLQQRTTFPFELVIGEDCSSDGTREIALGYQKRHPGVVRVITSERNVGMKRNGLRTLEACRGRYIAFCEGDDYWHHPGKLQLQADYLEEHRDCGLVFTDYDYCFESGNRYVRKVNQSKGYRSPVDLTIEQTIGSEGGLIRTCTIMARQDLLEQVIDGDPYLHRNDELLMGDLQLFAEFAALSKVSFCPESTATYRIHAGSATRNADPRKDAAFWRSACEIKLYLCDKYGLAEGLRKRVEADWYECSLRLAFHARNSKLAEEVRRKRGLSSYREWLQYYGAKHAALYYPVRLAGALRNAFARPRPRWA